MAKIDVGAEVAAEAERRAAQASPTKIRKTLVLDPGDETLEIDLPDIPEGKQAHVRVRVKVVMKDAPKKKEEKKEEDDGA